MSIILLIFNGTLACFGGYSLTTDPTGQKMQMPLSWLSHSPFESYYVPGLILLVVIGIGSLAVALLAMMKVKSYAKPIVAMGGALSIWIAVQMLMLQIVSFLQFIFGGIGIVLLALGMIQWKIEEPVTEP
jgi:hypothetical protein